MEEQSQRQRAPVVKPHFRRFAVSQIRLAHCNNNHLYVQRKYLRMLVKKNSTNRWQKMLLSTNQTAKADIAWIMDRLNEIADLYESNDSVERIRDLMKDDLSLDYDAYLHTASVSKKLHNGCEMRTAFAQSYDTSGRVYPMTCSGYFVGEYNGLHFSYEDSRFSLCLHNQYGVGANARAALSELIQNPRFYDGDAIEDGSHAK